MNTYTPTPIVDTEKAARQNRQYLLLTELQEMSRDIPLKFQQRIPCSLLNSLANSLLDQTVFEIVLHLQEIQQMTERKLMEQRQNLHKSLKSQRLELQKKHEDDRAACEARPCNLPIVNRKIKEEMEALEARVKEEVQKMDERIVLELDNCVSDQQSTLEKAGVPGFYQTTNPLDVRLQMYLLQFIHKMREKGILNS